MSLTTLELQGYRDALVRAVARGEKIVKYDGREVTFRDMSEIEKALTIIDSEIAGQSASANASRLTVFATDMD